MNMKRYNALLFILCVTGIHAHNKVSSWTKLCNGIIPSSWYAPTAIVSATTLLMTKSKCLEYIQRRMHDNRTPLSPTVLQLYNCFTLSCVIALVHASSNPLYTRTEEGIQKGAEELTKEIIRLTEGGLLDADEIVQKLEICYVTDLDTHLIKATRYVESLITRAEWYNQKLQIMGSWESVPYTDVLKAVLQKLVTSPLFASQRSARRWQIVKSVGKYGALGVTVLVVGVLGLQAYMTQDNVLGGNSSF